MKKLAAIAKRLSIPPESLIPYGHDKAKLDSAFVDSLRDKPQGKLVLVTAINPTPAGEGKTTTSIGLADALTQLGYKTALALREPSLGPCFGAKGGAIGGGRAVLEPADDINLHFTGDFHAITSAHNLIAAFIDNALYQGQDIGLNASEVTWRRVLDMNDRSLRHIITGLGQPAMHETGFDITTASEIMAVLCLASDLEDLRTRLNHMVIGWRRGRPVTVERLGITGALLALLKDAIKPNLVQTAEGTPAVVHGGPFANIAHGCNSVIATRTALGLADWVVTEAGFGADLGAEKFLNIKCRAAGLNPVAAVVVATVRALKYNGGAAVADLATENVPALDNGMPNLLRHCANLQQFGLPVVVAINRFATDTAAELATIEKWCQRNYIPCVAATHYSEGGVGAVKLAEAVIKASSEAGPLRPLYNSEMNLGEKLEAVARKIYHADGVDFSADAQRQLERLQKAGYGQLPVCVAKTQYSFSDDPKRLGAPRNFRVTLRELRLSAGAGFVVAIMGDMLLMPGLPKEPAALRVSLQADGRVSGLMGG